MAEPGRILRPVLTGSAATLGAGAALLGYALVEARMPVLRRVDVPVLAPGEPPVTILHLSDLHLTDRTEARVAWVRDLARLRPDVVVNTGDNLSFASGLEPLGRALEPFADLPGAFVLGDHDYHSTVFRSPTRYLRRDPRTADDAEEPPTAPELPWHEVARLQARSGWLDLTNTRGRLAVGTRFIELVGVDDPHVDRDRYPAPGIGSGGPEGSEGSEGPEGPGSGTAEGTGAGERRPAHGESSGARALDAADSEPRASDGAVSPLRATDGAALRLGLLHAPYRRVLDAMVHDGVDLALAGHTHGGQLCLPGYGALQTNCDIDRRRASGLSRWAGSGVGSAVGASRGMYLHVSAGLGTSPYTPVRIACRPEATLLTLLPIA